MRRHWLVGVVAFSIVSSLVPPAMGAGQDGGGGGLEQEQEPTTQQQPTKSTKKKGVVPAPKPASIEGSIVSLNLKPSQGLSPNIMVKTTDGRLFNFNLTPEPSVWRSGEHAKLSDLKEGQKIALRYSLKNGGYIVESIRMVMPTASVPATNTSSSTSR